MDRLIAAYLGLVTTTRVFENAYLKNWSHVNKLFSFCFNNLSKIAKDNN